MNVIYTSPPDKMTSRDLYNKDSHKILEYNKPTEFLYSKHKARFNSLPKQSDLDYPQNYGISVDNDDVKNLAFCLKADCGPCQVVLSSDKFLKSLANFPTTENIKASLCFLEDYLIGFDSCIEFLATNNTEMSEWLEKAREYSQCPKRTCAMNTSKIVLKTHANELGLLLKHCSVQETNSFIAEEGHDAITQIYNLFVKTLGRVPLGDEINFIYLLKNSLKTTPVLESLNLTTRDMEILSTLPRIHALYKFCILNQHKTESPFKIRTRQNGEPCEEKILEFGGKLPILDEIAFYHSQIDKENENPFTLKKMDSFKSVYSTLQGKEKSMANLDRFNPFYSAKFFNRDFSLLLFFIEYHLSDLLTELVTDAFQPIEPFARYMKSKGNWGEDYSLHRVKCNLLWADRFDWEHPLSFLDYSYYKIFPKQEDKNSSIIVEIFKTLDKLQTDERLQGVSPFAYVENHFIASKLGVKMIGHRRNVNLIDYRFNKHLLTDLIHCQCDNSEYPQGIDCPHKGSITSAAAKFFTPMHISTAMQGNSFDFFMVDCSRIFTVVNVRLEISSDLIYNIPRVYHCAEEKTPSGSLIPFFTNMELDSTDKVSLEDVSIEKWFKHQNSLILKKGHYTSQEYQSVVYLAVYPFAPFQNYHTGLLQYQSFDYCIFPNLKCPRQNSPSGVTTPVSLPSLEGTEGDKESVASEELEKRTASSCQDIKEAECLEASKLSNKNENISELSKEASISDPCISKSAYRKNIYALEWIEDLMRRDKVLKACRNLSLEK